MSRSPRARRPAEAASPGRRAAKRGPVQKEADAFLATVTGLLAPVSTSTGARRLGGGHRRHARARRRSATGADKALAALIGATTVIDKTKALLKNEKQLDDAHRAPAPQAAARRRREPRDDPRGRRQARRAGDQAVGASSTATPSACSRRATSCAKPITANDIDDVLKKSRDLDERQRVWTASKEIGRPLKPGLDRAQSSCATRWRARWATTRIFALKVADYGMTVDEMMKLLDDTLATTKPLYDGLHCWAKNQLAARYKRPAPQA